INIAEKGWVSLDVIASGVGGHSSIPPPKTAVGKLAEAIVRIQESPLPGGLSDVTAQMLDGLAPSLPFYQRVIVANRWLFGGLLEQMLGASAMANASMRTTIAPTMLKASLKENVLPIEAVARVNLRLHPRDTPESVLKHFEVVLEDHRDIELKIVRGSNASPIASTTGEGYQAIAINLQRVFGETLVVPGITVGGTDSKHYGEVSDNAYRFIPMLVSPDDLTGFHGTNERISVDNLAGAVQFYLSLIQNL
ncbi:MAG: M20/M25/M40 family metallo-hydrolase, partial [Halieaceae bacterium]|nr:M20/M25/M40 family metallo-hydrolase [Halieaceae bacterium]